MKPIQIMLTQMQHRKIKQLALDAGCSMSDYVRIALHLTDQPVREKQGKRTERAGRKAE